MKNPILIHNPLDRVSIEFKDYLDSIGFKYCLLRWYTDNDHPKASEEAIRHVLMYIHGAYDDVPKVGPLPEVLYSEEEIESGDFPNEYDRWIMQCDCHKDLGYIGPNLSVMPSLVFELESGELGMWECHPERNNGKAFLIEDLVSEKMRESVAPGLHLAGQTIESAMACASSPYYGNSIMKEAVRRHIKLYQTIDLSERAQELVTIRKVSHNSQTRCIP